jgi:hypothetical protein
MAWYEATIQKVPRKEDCAGPIDVLFINLFLESFQIHQVS